MVEYYVDVILYAVSESSRIHIYILYNVNYIKIYHTYVEKYYNLNASKKSIAIR